MSGFGEIQFSSGDLPAVARLFPLPSLVLFPHVLQPLHVCESRYRHMLKDALADDQLVAMAVLAPGWEADYEGRPPLYPMACLARITTHRRLETGAYNVLLLGLQRVRLLKEKPPKKLFREAEIELCLDHCPPSEAAACGTLQRKLRDALVRVLPMMPQAQEQLDQLLAADVPLGVLTDLIGYMLDISVSEKQALLAETNVVRRSETVLDHLAVAAADCDPGRSGVLAFPPEFSSN